MHGSKNQLKRHIWRLRGRIRRANHWWIGQIARVALQLMRRLPADRAVDLADRIARRLGPWSSRHRVALDNLRLAFPEKAEAEIAGIALEMWGNMGRLAAEYIFLDALFDYRPDAVAPSRIEVSGDDIFVRIASEESPHIIFTGHLGNFELLPVAGAAYGLDVTSLFRPPNNPYIAQYILDTRRSAMGGLVASSRGAAIELSRILEEGGNIGLLVDQKFLRGVRTRFFGRDCETSPLLPKLARHHDCDVYPARCIRLPGGRFRLEIEEKLALPRSSDGQIDVATAAQSLNDVVERWVREYPEQWMWFHRRWDVAPPGRRRVRARRSISNSS